MGCRLPHCPNSNASFILSVQHSNNSHGLLNSDKGEARNEEPPQPGHRFWTFESEIHFRFPQSSDRGLRVFDRRSSSTSHFTVQPTHLQLVSQPSSFLLLAGCSVSRYPFASSRVSLCLLGFACCFSNTAHLVIQHLSLFSPPHLGRMLRGTSPMVRL